MAPPKLVHARPNGQTSVLALFDQRMRELPPGAAEDPCNASLWSVGGGLPAVVSVIRSSPAEFELLLASAAPLGAGYTVTVADSVQSMLGVEMDPTALSQTFSVVTADLTIDSLTWVSNLEFDLVFSEALAQITYDSFHEVLTVQPVNLKARQTPVAGLSQSGTTLRVTLEVAGTGGAQYTIAMNREVFQSAATAVTLLSGLETKLCYGQGDPPHFAEVTITDTSLQASSTEVLGTTGWPKFVGAYSVNKGTLNTEVVEGSAPSIVSFPSARFTIGDSVAFSLPTQTRTVLPGESFATQATSVVGDGTETFDGSTTTLLKTEGDPYELVFSGGLDSLVRAGRMIDVSLNFQFNSRGSITLINAPAIAAGQTLTMTDATGQSVTLEATVGGPVTPGNIAWNINTELLSEKINDIGATLRITAFDDGNSGATLVQDDAGPAGHTTITGTLFTAGVYSKVNFTDDVREFPLAAITFLNTQMSLVVLKKAGVGLAALRLYRGAGPVGEESETFDADDVSLNILDATAEDGGYVVVRQGSSSIVVLGAPKAAVLATNLYNPQAGATAIALVLGSPLVPTARFSAEVSALEVISYFTTGLLGIESRDLFDLFGTSISNTVTASGVTPSGGYQSTGKAAFGVHAEYSSENDEVRVLIGLNEDAVPLQFTGSVTLLTGTQQPMDQILLDQANVLVPQEVGDGHVIPVVFLHPKGWAGILVGVTLEIGGVSYSTIAPVIEEGQPEVLTMLTQQPASNWHPRVQQQIASSGAETYGPASITGT